MGILMIIGEFFLLFLFLILAMIVAPRTSIVIFYTYMILGVIDHINYSAVGVSQVNFEFVGWCYLIFSVIALLAAIQIDKENFPPNMPDIKK